MSVSLRLSLPVIADLLIFPPFSTHFIHALPQPAFYLLISLLVQQCEYLSLPQHGETEEEVSKGGASQQLHG